MPNLKVNIKVVINLYWNYKVKIKINIYLLI